MQSQCEETVAEKAEEAEQAKLELIKIQQDLMLSEDKVCIKPAHRCMYFICSINYNMINCKIDSYFGQD